MDLEVAQRNLKEAKQIFDQMGIVFLLYSGTCLGAIRDDAFIPWDDDMDVISVVGINGLTDESVDAAVSVFKKNGYFVRESTSPYARSMSMIKDHVRIGWDCTPIIDDSIYAYPGVRIPSSFFTQPAQFRFLGERFLVPNPPEEYLRLKYGEEWRIPKKAGAYEKDVVGKIPGADLLGRPSRIRILDDKGSPVYGAEVVLVGGGRFETDESGYAEVILPGLAWYALIITYPGHEDVLYTEEIEPDKVYVYRADHASNAASDASGSFGTLGRVLLLE
jgi:hypothetical protein